MKAGPASLRRRVTIACAALGLIMSLLFSFAVVVITEDYEHVIASEVLRGQAEDYSLRIANGLPVQLPRTQRLSGYLTKPPAELARFGPGVHEDDRREGTHVGVFVVLGDRHDREGEQQAHDQTQRRAGDGDAAAQRCRSGPHVCGTW